MPGVKHDDALPESTSIWDEDESVSDGSLEDESSLYHDAYAWGPCDAHCDRTLQYIFDPM